MIKKILFLFYNQFSAQTPKMFTATKKKRFYCTVVDELNYEKKNLLLLTQANHKKKSSKSKLCMSAPT